MIELLNDKKSVENILKKHFKYYVISDDPYEKVAIYTLNDIIGVISYSIIYERAEINYIVVSDDYRKRGIASKLLSYALNDIEKNGCNVISLEVSFDNEPAINLYLKYGFKIKAVRENYYEKNDAYLMVKELEVKD